MDEFDAVLKEMTLEFFGSGQHKIAADALLGMKDAVFLDVRSPCERESVAFALKHHLQVLEIPTDEIPARIGEIPRGKMIGVFCSSAVRSAIVYAYLRCKGYGEVRIVTGGYAAVVEALVPGNLLRHLQRTKKE